MIEVRDAVTIEATVTRKSNAGTARRSDTRSSTARSARRMRSGHATSVAREAIWRSSALTEEKREKGKAQEKAKEKEKGRTATPTPTRRSHPREKANSRRVVSGNGVHPRIGREARAEAERSTSRGRSHTRPHPRPHERSIRGSCMKGHRHQPLLGPMGAAPPPARCHG